jgi:hypothetical protein
MFTGKPLYIRTLVKANLSSNLWDDVNDEVCCGWDYLYCYTDTAQFRDAEEILRESSDEMFESPLAKTYDEICSDAGDLIFPAESPESMASLHPPPVQIFRLWQAFLDNVNPLIKLFHAPTIQQQVLDACANLDNLSKGMHVLLFGIYAIATTSLTMEECQAMFGEERSTLLKRFQSGARQALLRAGFLRTSDMTILQGFVLYLVNSHSISRSQIPF